MKKSFIFANILLLMLAFALAGCPGPTITYSPKIGTAAYAPIETSKVEVFENMPHKGSYIEIGEIAVEDELKCSTDEAFQEEKTLSTLEKLRKMHTDLSKVTDIAMLELLAEAGKIERGDICALVPRFVRKEEKTNFVSVALKGTNQNSAMGKAAEIGANAIIKVKHNDWTMRGKPSGVGGDMAQAPSIKVGVRTTCTALKYEPPEEESKVVAEKVLEVVEDEKEEEEEEAEEEKEEAKEEKKAKKEEAKVEKKEEKPVKIEKKPVKVEKSNALAEAEAAEKELSALEKAIKEKETEQKDLKADIKKDKEELEVLKKELAKKKKNAAKDKAELEMKKAEEEKKAKMAAKKEAEEKAKKKAEEKTKKEAEEKAKKEPEEKAKKEPEEKKESTDILSEKDAKDGAKAKIKINKSKIFSCLHDGGMKGSIKVTYLFKPSGEIDALGFEPDAPDEIYECVMGILKGDEFPQSTKYYKAIFKYTMK